MNTAPVFLMWDQVDAVRTTSLNRTDSNKTLTQNQVPDCEIDYSIFCLQETSGREFAPDAIRSCLIQNLTPLKERNMSQRSDHDLLFYLSFQARN